jgi:outer membrane protein assembly factor BamB
VASSPSIVDDIAFVGSYDGNVYALNASNGNLVWSYKTDDIVVSSPAAANGVVYVGSYDHTVYAFGSPQKNGEKPETQDFTLVIVLSVLVLFGVVVLAVIFYRNTRKA